MPAPVAIAAPAPLEPPAVSGVVAVPQNGVPIIRRDSTKNDGDRPKRPINPPKNKDLAYEPKNLKKKKMTPEFRFCDDTLKELQKPKHWQFNQFFINPVDPVRDGAPDYYKFIKKPMDLKTMSDKLNLGEYNSSKDFENDFHLLVKNCRKYNSHPSPNRVLDAVNKLEDLFNQKWKEKDEWIASQTSAAAASASALSPGGAGRDSDYSDDGSDQGHEQDAAPTTSVTLDALNHRMQEENQRLTQFLAAKVPDMTMITTQQGVLAMIMKQIVDEKTKLAEQEKKRKPTKSKPSKAKKNAPAPTGRKNAAAGGGGAKKAAGGGKKHKVRVMGQLEKEVVSVGIGELEGVQLERAIDIIKKDTHQEVRADVPPPLTVLSALGFWVWLLSSSCVEPLTDISPFCAGNRIGGAGARYQRTLSRRPREALRSYHQVGQGDEGEGRADAGGAAGAAAAGSRARRTDPGPPHCQVEQTQETQAHGQGRAGAQARGAPRDQGQVWQAGQWQPGTSAFGGGHPAGQGGRERGERG